MVLIKFKTADWDDTAGSHNALAAETTFLDARVIADLDRPAKATIYLSDPDGTTAQKYDVDAAGDSVYIGPGRAYLYDDDDAGDASIFDGRIVNAIPDMANHRLILECEDWLSQLADRRIQYDMREDLDGAGLRQSELHCDSDAGYDYVSPVTSSWKVFAFDNPVYTDETTAATNAAADDMTLLPAAPAVNDCYYFGWTIPRPSFILNYSTQGDGDWTIVWEYYNGAAWATLPDISDGTGGFLGDTGSQTISWTIPADWAVTTVNSVADLYWVRARVSAFTSIVTQPLGTQVTTVAIYGLVDDDMSWTIGDWGTAHYCLLSHHAAGDITVRTGPAYTSGPGGLDDNPVDAEVYKTWTDDTNYLQAADDGAAAWYWVGFTFKLNVTEGSLYNSMTRLRFVVTCSIEDGNANGKFIVVHTDEATTYVLGDLAYAADEEVRRYTFTVPDSIWANVLESDGTVDCKLYVYHANGTSGILKVYYIAIEADVNTDGYSTPMQIYGSGTNRFGVTTDVTVSGLGLWEGCQYMIVLPIYKHIKNDGATYLGTLVTGGDDIYTITSNANIEATSGFSTRHYQDRTRLEILQDLAVQDKANFWVPIGTTALTWKSTFNNGTPTAVTDASVLCWTRGERNFKDVYNEALVYGATLNDNQIDASSTDATSKATYGIYRTQVQHNTGIFTEYDCTQLASKLVARDKDVKFLLQAELGGLSALRLGDEVSITSTYLGLTAQVYVIIYWAFDLSSYRTIVRLSPRASQTGHKESQILTEPRTLKETVRQLEADKYVIDLTTQTWT